MGSGDTVASTVTVGGVPAKWNGLVREVRGRAAVFSSISLLSVEPTSVGGNYRARVCDMYSESALL